MEQECYSATVMSPTLRDKVERIEVSGSLFFAKPYTCRLTLGGGSDLAAYPPNFAGTTAYAEQSDNALYRRRSS